VRVLVGCERFGIVRDAFLNLGHDAFSCDVVPSESPGPHIIDDVRNAMMLGWDLFIVHPDCTFLTVANTYIIRGCSKYTPQQAVVLRDQAVSFFMEVSRAPIARVAIENPVGIMSTRWRKPDQIIQPWHFGHNESKKTCLWLKNLPALMPTNILEGDCRTRRDNQTASGQNKLGPSPDRAMLRAKTYPGIAMAMATQWGLQ
jgi:hypothetical protein